MTDLHVHTLYCDGRNNPGDMVVNAIKKGVNRLGIVVHSYVEFDRGSCIKLEKVGDFIGEVNALKEKYRGKIDILCGVERDLYSSQDCSEFDYVIGSVHYLRHQNEYLAVDDTPEILKDMIDKYYCGDFYACAEDYFNTVKLLCDIKPDIIAHFDLIKKFKRYVPFDEDNPRYEKAWMSAADCLMKLNVPFEINTGGMLRGWTDEPYPSLKIINYIKRNGGKFVLSSDAHRCEDIAGMFEKYLCYV